MTIVVYLNNTSVPAWTFTRDHARLFNQLAPDTDIILTDTEEEFLDHLARAEACFVWEFKQEWFSRAPHLRIIITPAAGKDYFNITPPQGVSVHYSGFHGSIMAETAIAMMMAQARGLAASWSLQNDSSWTRRHLSPGMRLFAGSRVTVAGFGHIGTEIARKAKLMGARITGIKQQESPHPDFFDADDRLIYGLDIQNAFREALPATDHLVLVLPRSTSTQNCVNERTLELLPAHAAVYNLGRGNAIDEAALVQVLEQKRIDAAYLDVFAREPLPEDSPLRSTRNCFLLPHLSAAAPEYMELFCREWAAKIKDIKA